MKFHPLKAAAAFLLVGIVTASAALADSRGELDHQARETLDQFYSMNHQNEHLAKHAAGVLVFPRVVKGGLGIGGEHGDGVLFIDGHRAGYFNVSAASVGLTAGLARHSEVILFMDHHALDRFQNSHDWSVGADTDVAVISRGAGGSYDTAQLNRPILAFMFGEHGLIGDVSLAGSKITPR